MAGRDNRQSLFATQLAGGIKTGLIVQGNGVQQLQLFLASRFASAAFGDVTRA